MAEEEGIEWVRGTVRALMVKRRITYAELAKRLQERGVDENERNLRNKVARGTFSAVFFVQCLEAIGLESLTLDMTRVMATPRAEQEFAAEVPNMPSKAQSEWMDRTLASIRELAGQSTKNFEKEGRERMRELLREAGQADHDDEEPGAAQAGDKISR